MATFYINEFSDVGYKQGSTIPTFAGAQTDQTPITTSGTSQQSSAFATTTKVVRIKPVGGAVLVNFGSNPTATTSSMYLADGESFDYFSGEAGYKVAVIDA